VGANWATPTYDRNGNTTGDEVEKKFGYDAWNHLVAVRDMVNELLASYRYNALGWRVQEIRGEVTTDLYYSSQWQVLEERVSNVTTKSYVWSPVYVDAMIARDRDSDSNGSPEERLYAVHDANFNVVALLDTSGNVVERFAYDAFGVFSVLTPGWGARGSSSYAWRHTYQGLMWFIDFDGLDSRNRVLGTAIGRFFQLDRMGFRGADVNLYRAVANNPLGFVDPLGLAAKPTLHVFAVEGALGAWILLPTPDPLRDTKIVGKLIVDTAKAAGAAVEYDYFDSGGRLLQTRTTKALKKIRDDCSPDAVMMVSYSWGGPEVMKAAKGASEEAKRRLDLVFTIDPVSGVLWNLFQPGFANYKAEKYAVTWHNWWQQTDTSTPNFVPGWITGNEIGEATNIEVKDFGSKRANENGHTSIISHKPMLVDLQVQVNIVVANAKKKADLLA